MSRSGGWGRGWGIGDFLVNFINTPSLTDMSKHTGVGTAYKEPAWWLIKALFLQADAEASGEAAEFAGIQIERVNWGTNGEQNPKLEIRHASSETLFALIKRWNLNEYKNFKYKLHPEKIGEILTQNLEKHPLKIYKSLKNPHSGSKPGDRQFSLELWSINLEKNKKRFEEEWKNSKTVIAETLHTENIDESESNYQSDTRNNDESIEHHFLNSSQYIPYKGVNNFVGRQQELEKLHQAFHSNQRIAVTAVGGMGGVGKTELAIRYARDNEASYLGGICWLNARNNNLSLELLEFATSQLKMEVPQEISIEQKINWIWRHWKPPEGLVLIVLDDVVNLESCLKIIPMANRFRVLITTRLRNIDHNIIEEISLDVLSPEQSLQLLISTLEKQDIRIIKEKQTAEEICKLLGYLPLGLLLVGRYLAKRPHWSFAKMLQSLKEETIKNAAINPSEKELQSTLNTAQRGVKAAFELTWKELSSATQGVTKLLGLFQSSAFFYDWVESMIQKLSWSNLILDEANQELYEHHLIQWVNTEEKLCYKTHPLIREFLQEKIKSSEHSENIKESFVESMIDWLKKASLDYNKNNDNETLQDVNNIFLPHGEDIVVNLNSFVPIKDLIWLSSIIERIYYEKGLYEPSESLAKKCLSIVRKNLGNHHPDIAICLTKLANIYYGQEKYAEAEPLYQQSLDIRKRLLEESSPDIAVIVERLSNIYYLQREDRRENENLNTPNELLITNLLEELDAKASTIPNTDVNLTNIANSLNKLGCAYYWQGKYAEAEPITNLALSLMIISFCPKKDKTIYSATEIATKDSQIAEGFKCLADIYYLQKMYTTALPFYEQAYKTLKFLLETSGIRIQRNIYNITDVMHALVQIYFALERDAEAKSLRNQFINIKVNEHYLLFKID
ncbi:tetratricopeptide repeat protein [Scytonema tolypothrichoides VB-61278]|nr:tetratricopeptide repeat protein [Scytonema tolypothrichoides VB-61278]